MICLENAVLDRVVLSWPHIGHGHNLKRPEPCYFEYLELGRKDRDRIAVSHGGCLSTGSGVLTE